MKFRLVCASPERTTWGAGASGSCSTLTAEPVGSDVDPVPPGPLSPASCFTIVSTVAGFLRSASRSAIACCRACSIEAMAACDDWMILSCVFARSAAMARATSWR